MPPSQTFSRLRSDDAAEQKAVRFEPFIWLPDLTEATGEALSSTRLLAQQQASTSAAVDQYCLCCNAREPGSRFSVWV